MAFDATDLRVRVQSSFSVFELRRLLESWGASAEEAEGDTSTLAHRVVRLGYKRFGLGELVHKLRAEKPLTEWPDPGSDPDERWAGPPSLSGTAAAGFTAEKPTVRPGDWNATVQFDETQVTELEGAPTELELEVPTHAAPSSPVLAPLLPPTPLPPTIESAPVSHGAASGPASRRREGPDSRAPVSRGLVFAEPDAFRARPASAKSGSSTRTLLIVGGLMLVLGGAAFGAGLLWSRRGATPSSAKAEPSGRSKGPAGRAADLFDDGLRRVADTCGLTVTGDPSKEVFALAQEACGRDEEQRQERARAKARAKALAQGLDDLDRADPPVRAPAQDRSTTTARTIAPTPSRPSDPDQGQAAPPQRKAQGGGGGGCTSRCSGARDECNKACGPEPSDASQYGGYQTCTTRCITQETKCRRTCY